MNVSKSAFWFRLILPLSRVKLVISAPFCIETEPPCIVTAPNSCVPFPVVSEPEVMRIALCISTC